MELNFPFTRLHGVPFTIICYRTCQHGGGQATSQLVENLPKHDSGTICMPEKTSILGEDDNSPGDTLQGLRSITSPFDSPFESLPCPKAFLLPDEEVLSILLTPQYLHFACVSYPSQTPIKQSALRGFSLCHA